MAEMGLKKKKPLLQGAVPTIQALPEINSPYCRHRGTGRKNKNKLEEVERSKRQRSIE